MISRWHLAALLTTGLLAGLHFFALADFLYWRYRWFDVPMHMLGGAAIGVCAIALLRTFRPLIYIATILVAMVAWEIFEYYFVGMVELEANKYVVDTAQDILNGTLGALLVYVIARYTTWRTDV